MSESSTGPGPADTDEDSSSGGGSSSGGEDVSPLDHEGCELVIPSGEQTPEATEIAAAIEQEIVDLGRTDDMVLVDYGIRIGAGAGGADIFCLALALHSDWFASQDTFCVQDIDPEIVLLEVSEVIAEAPTLPIFAPLEEIESAAQECIGAATFIPCRGAPSFRQPGFDPNVVPFSTGEDDGECTFSSTHANVDAVNATLLSCDSDSHGTCDTEG